MFHDLEAFSELARQAAELPAENAEMPPRLDWETPAESQELPPKPAWKEEPHGLDTPSFGKSVEEGAKESEFVNAIKDGNKIAAENRAKELDAIREKEAQKKQDYRDKLYK